MVRLQHVLVWSGVLVAASTAYGGYTTLVSKGPNGNANSQSWVRSISGDGTKVAMITLANNLVATDTEFTQDAVLFDLESGVMQHVSTDPVGGTISPTTLSNHVLLSADGGTAFFSTSVPADLYAHDVATGVTRLLVDGGFSNSDLGLDSCSNDGRFVTFSSSIANLDPVDPDTLSDVFLYDTVTDTITLVNKDSSGATLPGSAYSSTISGDGHYVVFASPDPYAGGSPPFSGHYRKDLVTGAVVDVHPPHSHVSFFSVVLDVSDDGNSVLMYSNDPTWVAGDTNGANDIYLCNVITGTVELLSKNAAGVVGNGSTAHARMSGDANWVVMVTDATNLIPSAPPGAARVVLLDRAANRLHACALSNTGGSPNSTSFEHACVSDDGRVVAFSSAASNLVYGDSPAFMDAFVHRLFNFYDIGYGIAGTNGMPVLTGTGSLEVGTPLTVSLTNTIANAPTLLCVSAAETPVFTFGGTFVAVPLGGALVIPTDGAGSWSFGAVAPALTMQNLLQCLIPDAGASEGVAMSNAIVGALF